MSSTTSRTRRALASTTAKLSITAAAGAMAVGMGLAAASGASAATSGPESFSFALQASPSISACLPHARGRVTITPGRLNDTMRVSVHGLPARTGFDLFVIETPNKPFGVSWYQSDLNTGRHGNGTATVRGIFDRETFSVSPGGTTTFAPTHQYHLGLRIRPGKECDGMVSPKWPVLELHGFLHAPSSHEGPRVRTRATTAWLDRHSRGCGTRVQSGYKQILNRRRIRPLKHRRLCWEWRCSEGQRSCRRPGPDSAWAGTALRAGQCRSAVDV